MTPPEAAVEAKIQCGKRSSGEFSRSVLDPTAADISSLLDELASYKVGFMTVTKLDVPPSGNWAQVGKYRPRFFVVEKGKSLPSWPWRLSRSDGPEGYQFSVDFNSLQSIATLLIEWTFDDGPKTANLGGVEWAAGPEIAAGMDALEEFNQRPPDPLDGIVAPTATSAPQFVDVAVLQTLLEEALTASWGKAASTWALPDIYGFGLDSAGDPFLLPVAFVDSDPPQAYDQRWVPAESPGHLIGVEFFDEVNDLIGQSMEAFVEWADMLEGDDVDEMKVEADMRVAIFNAGVAALSELRSEGLFAGAPQLVVNLWHMDLEPTPDDLAHRCNPSEIAERYLAEVSTG